MNSPGANHLGNPLVTSASSVGSKKSIDLHLKAPNSPGSTFSKNDHLKLNLPLLSHTRATMRSSSSSSLNNNQRYTVSPNTSFTEREPLSTSSQGDCISMPQHASTQQETSALVGSTITTASSTIGLPSHYPGSVGHNRVGSLGSSILLEELQDFDDIYGQVHASDHSLSYTDNENDVSNTTRDSLPSLDKPIYDDDDDDDDLHALSRSMPFRLTLREHRRNVSELSATSLDIPSSVVTNSLKDQQFRSSVASTGSAGSVNSNNQRSSSVRSASTSRSHRRSRALSSNDFQKAVLEELEY